MTSSTPTTASDASCSKVQNPRRLLTSGLPSGPTLEVKFTYGMLGRKAGTRSDPRKNNATPSLLHGTESGRARVEKSNITEVEQDDPRTTNSSAHEGNETRDKGPLTHKQKITRLIELIVSKQQPRLRGVIKIELSKKVGLDFWVKRNGQAIIIQTSILPNNKRFPEVLKRFSRAALKILEAKPFHIPRPKMTLDEKRGWDGLLSLGAHLSSGGTAIDVRTIRPETTKQITQFLHFWDLAVAQVDGANHRVRDRAHDPVGVWTRERLG